MTPKEKAKELVNKFRDKFNWVEKDHNVDLYRDTKECALIAVDEILNSGIESDYYFDKSIGYYISYLEYYSEVKQEIELL